MRRSTAETEGMIYTALLGLASPEIVVNADRDSLSENENTAAICTTISSQVLTALDHVACSCLPDAKQAHKAV